MTEQAKTILFGLELRKEELREEIEKVERSCPETQMNIIKLDIRKGELSEEFEDIKEQIIKWKKKQN